MLFGRKKRELVRVLIVEDEPLIAFDTEYFLREHGFDVVATVDRVADALNIVASEDALHLVLVDMNLADGSGVPVARAAAARGVAVLFVTSDCPEEAPMLAAGCLAKPYPQRDLIAAIDAIETVRSGGEPKRMPPQLNLFPRAA
ncbi:MAG: response regulator [Pseudomonadota bacterium]